MYSRDMLIDGFVNMRWKLEPKELGEVRVFAQALAVCIENTWTVLDSPEVITRIMISKNFYRDHEFSMQWGDEPRFRRYRAIFAEETVLEL